MHIKGKNKSVVMIKIYEPNSSPICIILLSRYCIFVASACYVGFTLYCIEPVNVSHCLDVLNYRGNKHLFQNFPAEMFIIDMTPEPFILLLESCSLLKKNVHVIMINFKSKIGGNKVEH